MATLRSAIDRDGLTQRIDRLQPDRTPLWGRMTAPKMLAHVCDACRLGLGEVTAQPKHMPLMRAFPFKQLVIHVVPFPKNVPTAPEILSREPESFEAERARLKEIIVRLGHINAPVAHPLFGTLTPDEWGVLGYRHLDHHLRQFGV